MSRSSNPWAMWPSCWPCSADASRAGIRAVRSTPSSCSTRRSRRCTTASPVTTMAWCTNRTVTICQPSLQRVLGRGGDRAVGGLQGRHLRKTAGRTATVWLKPPVFAKPAAAQGLTPSRPIQRKNLLVINDLESLPGIQRLREMDPGSGPTRPVPRYGIARQAGGPWVKHRVCTSPKSWELPIDMPNQHNVLH